jgi:D-alanyl-D-alanine dipeptidase
LFTQNNPPDGFVYLDEYIPGIEVDLRYYSNDNFVGDTVDGYHANKCIISLEAAKALKKVSAELNAKGIGLKIFDAYRPQQAVNHFVRWAKDLGDTLTKSKYYPEERKSTLFKKGYIASKSGHSRGSAIDLTLIYLSGEKKGKEVDMGAGWDFFGTISWPSSDKVTAKQKENRMLLRNTMIKHGFKPYNKEWWHFTLKHEPFPDTYFNFPIN